MLTRENKWFECLGLSPRTIDLLAGFEVLMNGRGNAAPPPPPPPTTTTTTTTTHRKENKEEGFWDAVSSSSSIGITIRGTLWKGGSASTAN